MEIHNHYEVAIEIVVVNIIPIIKAVVVHVLPSVENLHLVDYIKPVVTFALNISNLEVVVV